ncbi:MAG: prepilin-type N-terminal cleavage/methylation domain-containing protein [Verrucomicrobia bacterium]|nr:prepilin-type N-terminal cleavage/methylation domain-containing protein [Verrucomicrobiota bacterium]
MRIRTQSAKSGFTLIEIMIVVAIIGMLMAIAVPNIAKAGKTARRNACMANIKNIESVIEQYKLEQRTAPADLGVLVSAGYFKTEPTCPEGGTYTISPEDGEVTCSIPTHNSSASATTGGAGQ